MSDEPLLPPRLTLLGEAMRPVWLKTRAEIDKPIRPIALVVEMSDILSHHFDSLQTLIHRLEERINRFMSDVVSNEAASDADVYRSVGRFEALLDDLTSDYQDVRALNALGADVEARDMLAGVYRHTLVEMRDWMQELVETLADPLSALQRRGLPTSGHVELPLTLTSAPQLAGLLQWAKHPSVSLTTSSSTSAYRAPRRSGLGFWGMVGAAVLGWCIGEALFGDDDCGSDGDV
jgi:hypothetical protein